MIIKTTKIYKMSIDYKDFISEVPVEIRTPSMTIHIFDKHNKKEDTLEMPAGFQLERYVSKLYPDEELNISFELGKFVVSVSNGKKFIGYYHRK